MQKGKVPDYLPNKPTVVGSRGSEGILKDISIKVLLWGMEAVGLALELVVDLLFLFLTILIKAVLPRIQQSEVTELRACQLVAVCQVSHLLTNQLTSMVAEVALEVSAQV